MVRMDRFLSRRHSRLLSFPCIDFCEFTNYFSINASYLFGAVVYAAGEAGGEFAPLVAVAGAGVLRKCHCDDDA